MSRTVPRPSKGSNQPATLNEKTEKKRPRHSEMMATSTGVSRATQKKLTPFDDESAQSDHKVEFGGWETILAKRHLRIENPPQLRINRARILDWLLDVCRAFELRWESYWCAVEMLDHLIFEVESVKITNIHMLAVTALFMASKIHQTNPVSLAKLVTKAVYNAFSEKDVIQAQAEILLECSNGAVKPRYLYTVYNVVYEICPNIPEEARVEIMRRLVLVWMDPVAALGEHRDSQETTYISYQDIVGGLLRSMESQTEGSGLRHVYEYFRTKHECENIEPGWAGWRKIKM